MLDNYTLKPLLRTLDAPKEKTIQHSRRHRKPIKLSIISQFYPPDYAATGQLISELATQLGKLGLQVNIFTGQPGYAYGEDKAPKIERDGKIQVRRSRTSRMWSRRIRARALNGLLFCLRAAIHLCKSVNRGDVLLLTTEPPYLPILGYFAHLLFGLPYVCLLYDIYPDIAVNLHVIPEKHWLVRIWRWLNRQVWKNAQSAIVLSSSMKERIVAECPEIADKITVIHSWANPNWIKPIDKQDNWFACEFDLANKFTVLYSGNMGRCHDMDTILAAAAQLSNEPTPIQFVFIGNGAKRKQCLEQVCSLGLTNCRFLPYQDRSVLPYSLTACDLSLVSVSPGMEGLIAPSKLYGILAAGRPVAAICEPHSYLRNLLAEANCGEAFDNGDGTALANFIRRLANDSELTAVLGNSGRSYLQSKFTPEIIARQYWQIVSRIR
ncbi:glycosyltransferase family 4 protein [Oscillatoria salina]|uniref:glycosyltransferase family 4 protein n=1 Tax=Oscillatoria salina TaxID=331517 RepID=UPI0013B6C0BF|nr:glycosyltransferase family 4 protein [Oscillatoria salina]MBZ8179759.1 glycosyltransferase family 4 protein [Oscillatoria salina IIICB1]NET87730.1 glycosyltransferase family 4 protein [Kamptonema sp. SIO1D9]